MTLMPPQNIVEAYSLASKASELDPSLRGQAYRQVIRFCETDTDCSIENSLKRNMLLFWAYNTIAEEEAESKHYTEALHIWQKAKHLPREPEIKIALGQKMLDAADLCRLSIPEKAAEILEICRYLQSAYHEAGDEAGYRRIEKIREIADALLAPAKSRH